MHREPTHRLRAAQALYEAEAGLVAARISSLRHDATSWVDPRAKPRMSLAGQQGKFSVAHIRGRWFWPTYETPSTHIVKPAAQVHELLDYNEAGALNMAHAIGISASEAEVVNVEDQRAFMTKRWDRTEDGFRVHAEDMAQAHGLGTAEKYSTTAPQIARELRQHGADARPFVEQLAFNTYLWNADAHGKNYSVLLDAGNIELAPLYDAVPTRIYPDYEEALAMPIGRTASPSSVGAASWAKFAVEAGLSEDKVVHTTFTIRNAVADRYENSIASLPNDPASERNLQRHVKRLRQQIRNEP